MRIANTAYDFIFELRENTVASIVCEHPAVFYELTENIGHLLGDENSCWILSESNGERIKSSKMDVIYSPFCFEINSRKLLSKVHKDISEVFCEEYFDRLQTINNDFLAIVDDIAYRLNYNIDFSLECDVKDMLKMYNVILEEECRGLQEKLTTYVKLLSSILGIKFLFLVDIKRYLTREEIEEVYKEAFYQKVNLILIESKFEDRLPNEDVLIIDNHRCIIKM